MNYWTRRDEWSRAELSREEQTVFSCCCQQERVLVIYRVARAERVTSYKMDNKRGRVWGRTWWLWKTALNGVLSVLNRGCVVFRRWSARFSFQLMQQAQEKLWAKHINKLKVTQIGANQQIYKLNIKPWNKRNHKQNTKSKAEKKTVRNT